jgi:benzylsuccinate CoA-transferase BbsE subunit
MNIDLGGEDGPLAGTVVVDATTALGWYPGKLLADLGADVLSLESVDANTEDEPAQWPIVNGRGAREVFAGARQRRVRVDGDIVPAELLRSADLLLTSEAPQRLLARGLHPESLADFPRLVHIAMSPYGLDGPHANRPATDLTLLAAGGLLALAGEPDRAPVRPAGEQSAVMVGLHATVGALIALLARDDIQTGQTVDVSAQQAVAHSLENAIQFADLEGVVRRRTAGTDTEVGNGLFACADGWIYLVAGIGGSPLGWDGLLAWLANEGLDVTPLRHRQWVDPIWRKTHSAAAEFRRLFESFAASRPKQYLYRRGQEHGVSIAPVATPNDLLRNPHLRERAFFRTIDVDGHPVTVPGPPYRFSPLAPDTDLR